MARECVICGKGRMTGNKVSHSHRKTRRVWEPNLQKVKYRADNQAKRGLICTKCLKKTGKVEKA